MAVNLIYTDLNFLLVSQLLGARTQNLTTSGRTTLGGTLNTSNIGLHVWDTDLSTAFYWNGTGWSSSGASGASWGGITGTITDQTDLVAYVASQIALVPETNPGGVNTQLQYNNAGVFGGITGATSNGTIVTLAAPVISSPVLSGTTTGTTWNLSNIGTFEWDSPNTMNNLTITNVGTEVVGQLLLFSQVGSGTRMLTVDASGIIGNQAIPIVTAPSWDDTLAVGNTTSRRLNFVAAADGYEIFRAFTNSVNNTAPYQLIIDRTPNGPPDDNVRYEGWNIDSGFDSASPSWTTRLEYKYLGSLYEYHLQWSSLVTPRTYRLMSHTFHDTGSTATDINTIFFSATQFEIRDFATNNSFVLISSTGGGTTLSVVDTTGNSGVSYSYPASGVSCTVSPQGAASLNWIFAPTWANVYFGNTLHWASAKPTFLSGLGGTDSNAFEVNSAGGQSTIVLRSSGTASLVQNETFNQSYYAANNSGGHFFWTANATALADFQIDAVGPSHIWNSTIITNPTGTGTDLLIRPQVATHNASVRLLLPDTDLGLQFYTLNSTYVTNGVFVARGGAIISTQAEGMAIACNDPAGNIRFATGGLTEVARFEASGKLTFAGSLTTRAIMNLAVGAAPTSPVDGDLWREDNTNTGLKVRINGVTKTITVS